MKILMTGGTGLIGKTLIDALLTDGHEISVLTRNVDKARDALPSGVIPFKWDTATTQGWDHLIPAMDAVINLAGESLAGEGVVEIITKHWNAEYKKRIRESRENVGSALVAAIEKAEKKPKVFIQASAVGYYGPRADEKISETSDGADDFLAETCRLWEDSTQKLDEMGVRRAIIRTGLVLSEEGGILPMVLLPFRLFAGGPLGSGKQYVSWIHMDDQVNAIRFLLNNEDASGVYNLTAPNPVTQREQAKVIGRVLRRPSFIPVPGFALKLVLGEKSTLVLDGQRVIPQKLEADGFAFKFTDFETALADLL